MSGFHQSFDRDPWIVLLIFGSLCDGLLFAGFCYAINAFRRGADAKNIASGYKVLSLSALAFLLLGQIFSAMYVIIGKLPGGTVNSSTLSLWSVYNAFWSVGCTFTYALYYSRIEKTFKGQSKCSEWHSQV